MSFWELRHPDPQPAFFDAATGRRWTYGELRGEVERLGGAFSRLGEKRLGFLLCRNDAASLTAYLAALQAQHAVALISAQQPYELLERLAERYRPDWIVTPNMLQPPQGYGRDGGSLLVLQAADTEPIHADLALLLSTSGTTGSPKLVRLSYRNVESNAAAIAQYLSLSGCERPVTSLPMHYSYGLSVINSHLHAGAETVLTERSVMQREFWDLAQERKVTSFAGVPFLYETLLRFRMLERDLPIKTFTQAGGRLSKPHLERLHAICEQRDRRLFVMYGQTEATARISYVPPARLKEKLGSIGLAIPGGKLSLRQGELFYSGPNVMMGYAVCRADLARGDEMHGELPTGDLGEQDSEGFFYVTGRRKRFIKIYGQRVNLDELESALNERLSATVACYGADERLAVAMTAEGLRQPALSLLDELFHIHPNTVAVSVIERLPRLNSGKIDYAALVQ